MSFPVLIVGESGSGKTCACRNLDPSNSVIVQLIPKPLPFRAAGWKQGENLIHQNDWGELRILIRQAVESGVGSVVVDDFQYLLACEFMSRALETGYQKFSEFAQHYWEVMRSAACEGSPTRVYFLSHSETNEAGRTKAKTIGRMLDEKLTVEAMFSIVLRSLNLEGQHRFAVVSDGNDTTKAPMGMFAEAENGLIDNCLATVDREIVSYYGLEN